ncbi:Fic family protein [Robbsia sp. KACC 23696]|uniref:Fic family protein n=1 Tax=Robbsia sp. KACC 23696 TaxID=3149231 RepID=UPI00325BD7B3
MQACHSRAGKTVPQGSGYLAYVPAKLPPSIGFDGKMIRLLSEADIALGRLAGITEILPNPDLFVAMYVRKEAVLSSQIEGIQCTLDEVLEAEVHDGGARTKDIAEVVNYVDAMNYGMERLATLPLSLRLIRETHSRLMDGVRGEHKDPGEFRKTQNWIGPQGSTLSNASFVPPPVPEMNEALSDLEQFMHDRHSLPVSIQCAITHLQFETIHPFLDGNGRVGRLLVPLMLHQRQVMAKPLLYISHYLKANRFEYYDRLMDVRVNGNWEGWVKFFLTGVAAVGHEAADTAKRIVQFRTAAQQASVKMGKPELALIDHLFRHPIMDARAAERLLDVTYATANNALSNLENEGLVKETTGKKRNRVFRFQGYLQLFDDTPNEAHNIYDREKARGYQHGA